MSSQLIFLLNDEKLNCHEIQSEFSNIDFFLEKYKKRQFLK